MLPLDVEGAANFVEHHAQVVLVDLLLPLFVLVAEHELDRLLGECYPLFDALEDFKDELLGLYSCHNAELLDVFFELLKVDQVRPAALIELLWLPTLLLLLLL